MIQDSCKLINTRITINHNCPVKNFKDKTSINIGSTRIEESYTERILGVQVQNTLECDDHVSKVISKVNHGLATIRMLRGLLQRKALKMIAEGIVLSHIRYGIGVYLSESIRIDGECPLSSNLIRLQINKMSR